MNYKFILALVVSAVTQPFICCMHVDAPLGLDLLIHYRPHDDSSQDKNDIYRLTNFTEHQRAEQLLNDVIDVAKGKKLVNKAKLNELFLSAVQYGNTTTFIDDLLEKGADIGAQNALGDTALHLAIEKGYRPAITVIFEWAKKNSIPIPDLLKKKNWCNFTPLHLAAKQLLVAESRLFLANGAQVDAKGGKKEDIDFIDCALLGAWRLEKKRFHLLAMIKLLCKEYNAQVYPRHLSFIKKIEPSSETIKESLTNTQILLNSLMC